MTGPGEGEQDLAFALCETSTEVAHKIFLAPGVADRMLSWRDPVSDTICYKLGF